MSPTSPQQVVVMEFGKRHHTASTNTTDYCTRKRVTYLLRTCCEHATEKLHTGKLV